MNAFELGYNLEKQAFGKGLMDSAVNTINYSENSGMNGLLSKVTSMWDSLAPQTQTTLRNAAIGTGAGAIGGYGLNAAAGGSLNPFNRMTAFGGLLGGSAGALTGMMSSPSSVPDYNEILRQIHQSPEYADLLAQRYGMELI